MRAPAPSLSPITGAPTLAARSMILQIFSAKAPERLPPKTVKSCAKTKTRRPSTSPWPVTTPSPGIFCSAIPKSVQRWVTNLSISTKVPGSKSSSSRSRAVSFPPRCCRSMRSGPPPRSARSFSSSSLFSFSSMDIRGLAVGGGRSHVREDGAGLAELLAVLDDVELLPGDAAVHRRLRHRGHHVGEEPRVEGLRDDVVRPELEVLVAVGVAHDLGHDLAAPSELGERLRRGDLHRLVDPGRLHVERAAEDEREAEDVVHLVGEVRAPRRDDRVLADRLHLLGQD